MATNKTYSKQTLKGWLHWFFDTNDQHITMRLAGNPSMLLEEYRKMYWDKWEWDEKYLEMLEMLQNIWERWKSPFVFYFNDKKELP